ncbi:MAG TPA: twin-arginine translocase TatA/TatE family subunit [Acidimicrobiales bacterium]|nr:twin-arginine translocase TatA/TatE family subunit [Acidimicrobiales bacterium]
MNLGPAELMIILVIALVLFGGKKLPGLARSLGEAQNEFRKGVEGTGSEPAATVPAEPRAVAPEE